jgi:hypothetical protein
VAQVVRECLANKCEALRSNLSAAKKIKERKKLIEHFLSAAEPPQLDDLYFYKPYCQMTFEHRKAPFPGAFL